MIRRYATLVLCFVTSMVLLTAAAKAASPAPSLSGRLPVSEPVYCPSSQGEWNADPNGGGGVLGYTYVNGQRVHQIHLSFHTCTALLAGPSDSYFPVAAQTLYHEWVHAYFLQRTGDVEGNAECVSLFFYRYALRHFWGVSAKDAQRDYVQAVRDHVTLGIEFPEYKGSCTFPQPDPVP